MRFVRSTFISARRDNGVGFCTFSDVLFAYELDLRPDVDDIISELSTRILSSAEFNGLSRPVLVEKCGTTDELLARIFIVSLVITRSRQQIPPQPYAWFRTLIQSQGKALEIRVAYQDETPRRRSSHAAFQRRRLLQIWLFGRAIFKMFGGQCRGSCGMRLRHAKSNRSNMNLTWGAQKRITKASPHSRIIGFTSPKTTVYWRFPETSRSLESADGWKLKMAKRAFSQMPNGLLTITGKLIYRHIG